MKRVLLMIIAMLVGLPGLTACGSPDEATSPLLPTVVSPLPSPTARPLPTWTLAVEPGPTVTETPVPTLTETPVPTPVPLYTGGVWECWDRGQSIPCPYDASLSLKQMVFVSEREAWAVGGKGYIARWDGYTWTRVESPTDKDLNDVAFLSSDDGWAVGEGGLILHWDGSVWLVVRDYKPPLPGSGHFLIWNAVAFSSPSDGWVVGCMDSEGGATLQAMHWNGTEWQDLPMPPRRHSYCFTAIAVLSPQDIWAVGGGDSGIVLRWNGEFWQEISIQVNYWLFSASAILTDDIWVAGMQAVREGSTAIILHWNGREWLDTQLPPTTGWINSILMISDYDGWAGGDELFHWNGQGWEKAANPAKDRIVDIESDSSGGIWALTQHGAFLRLEISR